MAVTRTPAAIPANLRRAREAKGVSQRRLARMVGIDHSAIAHVEAGRTTLSVGSLCSIANALDVTTDSLLTAGEP